MRPESVGEAVELRTTFTRDRADCDSSRDSETYCHAVQINPIDHALPDVVSQNTECAERTEDPYDTIGTVGTIRGTRDTNAVLPNVMSYSGEDNKGSTASSDGDMVSSQTLAPYAAWSQLNPKNQPPPADVRPGWCSKKRVLIIGIIVLILVLVSSLTVTTTLLITGTSGQTGGNPPPSSTKATSTPISTAPPTTPATSTTTSTSTTVPSSISTATTPRLNSTPTTIDTSSPHANSTFTSTPATSTSPSASTTLASSSTSTISVSPSTTTAVLASSTTPTTTTAASTTTSPTITSCSSSRKCHSCNSRNSRCPVNGTMAGTDPGQVMPCPCGTACFSAVRYSDGNVVHRGCTKEYPLWDSASSTDLSCREIADDHFLCFCLGDRCNTHDMTPYIPL